MSIEMTKTDYVLLHLLLDSVDCSQQALYVICEYSTRAINTAEVSWLQPF